MDRMYPGSHMSQRLDRLDLYRTRCNGLPSPRCSLPEGWRGPPGTGYILPPIPVGSSGQLGLRQDSPWPLSMQASTCGPAWAPSVPLAKYRADCDAGHLNSHLVSPNSPLGCSVPIMHVVETSASCLRASASKRGENPMDMEGGPGIFRITPKGMS